MTFGTELREVWVTYRFVGFHKWADAPNQRAYLRDAHRHVFHVQLHVSVAHDNRDIEFHDLLDQLAAMCNALDHRQLGSCEQIAHAVACATHDKWPRRRVRCSVSEDGENGATVTLLP